ncbi:MAG: nuclear transport factor 2 family protein [Sphingobium sp.]
MAGDATVNNAWEDMEAIRTLKARYFRLMDTKDWVGWRALFTDDLVAIVDTAVSTRGADGRPAAAHRDADSFVAFVKAAIDACITVHHGHMPEIELTSATQARGIWAMEDIVQMPGQPAFRGFGHYHETYRKDGDGWRIATLHLTRTRLEGASRSLVAAES